jgi:hypothetical protein
LIFASTRQSCVKQPLDADAKPAGAWYIVISTGCSLAVKSKWTKNQPAESKQQR